MKQFQASIEFLTPVHIGSGESLGPYEYFIRDGKFNKLNMPKFISSLTPEQRKSFLDLQDRDEQIKLRTFPKQNAKKETVDLQIPVSKSIENEYNQKISGLQNRLDINLFPQDGVRKKPFLPGSSLKGAFRTAILQMFVKKNSTQDFRNNEKSFESTILKYANDMKKDVFRALKIPDISLESTETEILDCQMFNPKKPAQGSFDQRMQVTFSRISRIGQSKAYSFEFLFYEDLISKANLPEKFSIQDLGNSCNEHI